MSGLTEHGRRVLMFGHGDGRSVFVVAARQLRLFSRRHGEQFTEVNWPGYQAISLTVQDWIVDGGAQFHLGEKFFTVHGDAPVVVSGAYVTTEDGHVLAWWDRHEGACIVQEGDVIRLSGLRVRIGT